MAPDNDNYEMSFVEFNTEKLENYNWNYLDYYVATRGDQEEFVLNEKLKHWRFRLYLLPVKPFLAYTAQIKEGAPHCDVYKAPSVEETINMAEGFLRFVETCLNKIKRPSSITSEMQRWGGLLKSLRLARKKSRSNTMAVGDLKNSAGFLRFRERVGSRGREARDRVVSGPVSRPLDGRHRTESGGGLVTATMEPLAMSQVEPSPEPVPISQVNDSGSHDSVFGVGASDGLSSMESQVRPTRVCREKIAFQYFVL